MMVLTATDPFEYESPEHEVKNMLHATVATVSQYFHVKVFNIDLKEKFTKNNFITISNYFESKGILEINETSSVLEAAPKQMIEVPNCITRNANASPKICDIQKGTSGAVFYGVFTLHKVRCENLSFNLLYQHLETNNFHNNFHLVLNDSIATQDSTLARDKKRNHQID